MYNDMYEKYPDRNPMTAAAVIFGIISIFSCAVIYIAVPAGALAFLFALLSRTESKISGKGKAGIICGLLGMVLSTVITVFSFYFVFTNDSARSYLNQYFKYYMGDSDFSFEEEMNELFSEFGFSFDPENYSETSPSPEDDYYLIPDNTIQEEGAFL